MANYFLYRVGKFISCSLPLKLSYKIAVFFSDLNYLFAFADRKAVKANLRAIFPEKTGLQIKQIRRRMFRNFAKYLVDFFRFSKIDSEYIKKNIKIENRHYFDEALSKGKGVVVLTAHLGNWELGGVVIALSGYPLWVVALPHKNKKVDNFFNYQRESKGMHVIPFGRAARQCLNLLKENQMVALVGDRDFSEKGMVVDFFGRQTLLPVGPAAFVMKTQSVILPGFMLRNPDDTFTLKMDKPIEFSIPSALEEQDKAKVLSEIINSYKVIIEGYIRRYPEQWYMFRRFWVE